MPIETPSISVPFVDLAAQHAGLAPALQETLRTVFECADYILGSDVALFEEAFARFCETRFAVGVDSGTSALELILRAYAIGPGDEVITAANTFMASVLAISATGATPVLVDVDPVSYTLDPRLLEAAITSRTKAIMPVHLYGQPADMDPILAIAQRHGLVVIEDACQAHGARYKGRRVGGIGHAAAFSFYPTKNLGGYGDGGMVVTLDPWVHDTVLLLRNYGQRAKYQHEIRGFNRRLDTIQAALLRVKLPYLDQWNAARRQHAQRYTELLCESTIMTPAVAAVEPVWHLYVIRSPRRDALRNYLESHGIATGIHYPVPIHLQHAYADLGYPCGTFPITEQYAHEVLSLPLFAELTNDQLAYVAHYVQRFHEHKDYV